MTTRPYLGEQPTPALSTIAQRDPARAARLLGSLRNASVPLVAPSNAPVERTPRASRLEQSEPVIDRSAPAPSRQYRRGSIFHMPGAIKWHPLDRNQRAKVWTIAQSMERLTKQKGKRNGCISGIGLRVLNCLLYRFQNSNSGRCDPSYDALQKMTGLCRGAITKAIDRLEASGLLTVTRRMIRARQAVISPLTGRAHECIVVRQISNAYVITEPNRVTIPGPCTSGSAKPFPKARGLNPMESTLNELFQSIIKPSLSSSEQSKHPLNPKYATVPVAR